MQVLPRTSPNHDARDAPVDMLVMHYTGMQSAAAALERLTDPAAKVSAHYTIDEDGTVYAHVPEARRAWHAGRSFWAGRRNVNSCSIGVELVNPGHEFGYRPFPQTQIAALIELSNGILARHAIVPSRVLGHSDVAPARKDDPGELFPWQGLAGEGIGVWPRAQPGNAPATELARYGYDPEVTEAERILAFQRHFRPAKLDGVWDGECAGLLAGLLDRL